MSQENSACAFCHVCGASAAKPHAKCASDMVYRRLVQSITDYAIYMLDVDGVLTTWNAGA